MIELKNIEVELVEHSPGLPLTGIGRYTRELYWHLLSRVSVRMVTHIIPPLTRFIAPLHYFPIGVSPHQAGSVVHFMEDLGCSQMFWRPMRPAVATSHDLGFLVWPREAHMHRILDRILLRLSYLGLKRMDAVITVSEFSRQMVIRRLGIPAERVFTVYSGNDHHLFRPVAYARQKLAARYSWANNTKYKNLLYVGSELPRKNLITLLRALRQLPSNVRLLKVGVAGPKRFRAHTQKLIAEFDLAERVIFLEQVPEEELPLLYSAADVYICASFLEGFGHPVVEAMACGLPVVCSNTSALPEITDNAAILIPPEDTKTYTEAVLCILNDKTLCDRMVTRGLQQAANFSWDQTADGVTKVYERVMRGNGYGA